MHRKYDKVLEIHNTKQEEFTQRRLASTLRDERERLKPDNQTALKICAQLADILKYMGLQWMEHDMSGTSCTLWAKVKDKEDIEAFNKVVWSFGFKHEHTGDTSSDTVSIDYKCGATLLRINYHFGEEAKCKMVKVGTKEVDVFERRCGEGEHEAPMDLEHIATDEEPAPPTAPTAPTPTPPAPGCAPAPDDLEKDELEF